MRRSLISLFSLARVLQIVLDLAVSLAAWYAAYVLRFDAMIPSVYRHQMYWLFPAVLVIRFVCRFPLSMHRQLWRYVSLREVSDIVLSISLGSAMVLATSRIALVKHVPWGILALDWGLNLFGYLALRGSRRAYAEWQPHRQDKGRARKRVLLVGAGQAGNLVAKEILQRGGGLEAVGFVDDDPQKTRSRVQGLEVVGTTEDLPALVDALDVAEVILCVPSATPGDMRRILERCREAKVAVKTVPGIQALLTGSVEINTIRAVQIEDLLNRDPVTMDRASAGGYLADRVVMVTGAGGSIGSELCRQIATLGPSSLILVGRGEYSIYTIEQELRESFPALSLVAAIADVRDAHRMAQVFASHTPDVVFHAAAHKHVPLMETNPTEAVFNNVFGTRTVAGLAHEFKAEAFVLVSSDKAVNPTNVMGATKRVAEQVVQELAARSTTRFMSVRFGNVLDSRGSVIPLFKRQIQRGGPITITHPDIIRYFMTIPEASQLVIQAGALGRGGEVFVLDMGEPVKIVDLARDLIKLSGLEPDVDIKLQFTGLRPGEKLYEELLTSEEGTTATSYKKIFMARPEPVDAPVLDGGLGRLRLAATEGDEAAIRRELKTLVASYHFQGSRATSL